MAKICFHNLTKTMENQVITTENPYLAVITRKCRRLKKRWSIIFSCCIYSHFSFVLYILLRLEKIQKSEQQLSEGKIVHLEQMTLVATKDSVERQLADFDELKAAFEEVAAQEVRKSCCLQHKFSLLFIVRPKTQMRKHNEQQGGILFFLKKNYFRVFLVCVCLFFYSLLLDGGSCFGFTDDPRRSITRC